MSRCISVLTLNLATSFWLVTAHAASQPESIDLRVDQAPLSTLIERIARQCDAGLVIESSLQDRMNQVVTINAKEAAWKDALALLASEYRISLSLVDDRLQVVDVDAEFRKLLVTKTYDVRTLTLALESFPGPSLDIPEPGGRGAMLLPPTEPDIRSEAAEISDTIMRHVHPAAWQRGGMSISQYSPALVITATPQIHKDILLFLQRLERAAAREVVCRIFRLPDNYEVLPVVLDAKAWQAASGGGTSAGAPLATFIMLDAQQNHHFSGAQSRYIADADVVQGIYDPIVTVLAKGLMVEIEPAVTLDGVIAAIRFEATIDSSWTSEDILDPSGKSQVSMRQPHIHRDISNDSRLVPSGGASVLRFAERTYAVTFEVVTLPEPKAEKPQEQLPAK